MTKKTVLALSFAGALLAEQGDSLALCSRCASPTVYAQTGTGTENAVAEAKFTDASLRDGIELESDCAIPAASGYP